MYVLYKTNPPFLFAPITQANIDQKGHVCTKTHLLGTIGSFPKRNLLLALFVCPKGNYGLWTLPSMELFVVLHKQFLTI